MQLVSRVPTVLQEPYALVGFFLRTLERGVWLFVRARVDWRQGLSHAYTMGVQSLVVVGVSVAFISILMVVELSVHMKWVLQQDTLVPAFSTLLMLRELGPVVTCLLLTSRVGASIGAELGLMKNTDQIDALRLLNVPVIDHLVVPRWFAAVTCCVCLSVVSVAIAIVAGAWVASVKLGFGVAEFFNTMFVFTQTKDGVACITKAAVFGTIMPIVASYHGLNCKPGSEGVGNAATSVVVQSSILIIIADFVVTYVLYKL